MLFYRFLVTLFINQWLITYQTGGGIVFDSEPQAEYQETINKLAASTQCIKDAETYHAWIQGSTDNETVIDIKSKALDLDGMVAKVDLGAE